MVTKLVFSLVELGVEIMITPVAGGGGGGGRGGHIPPLETKKNN